ncbi:MAG: hypothetical protein F6J97_05640 [Leptolyngbya sp. SIO4C1]|nr:hypothetical protein [Leptolyngbya sp. SIO4C1]
MTWRGSTTAADRVFSALPYLLPLTDAARVGGAFFRFIDQFPALRPISYAIQLLALPANILETSIPFGSLVIFFLLIFLVVRNTNISHFIRFNALQAILIGFIIVVCNLVIGLLAATPGFTLVVETLANVIFLGGIAAVAYAIVQSLRGQYAEIPTISEAVHMQVR